MEAVVRKILDRATKHRTGVGREYVVKIISKYAETVGGRQKLAESVLNPIRIRFDHKISSFKDGRDYQLNPHTMVSYSRMLREVDGLISESDEFSALAYTPREKEDIAFRKLAKLTDEMRRFRSELSFRCQPYR